MSNFGMDVGDLTSEAFERCGVDASSVEHRHLVSARRSLNLLFTGLVAGDFNETDYVDLVRVQVGVGQRVIVLADDTLDILDVVIVNTIGSALPLNRTSRQSDLTQSHINQVGGTPSLYWISKTAVTDLDLLQQPATGLGAGGFGYGTFGGGPAVAGGSAVTDKPLMILWPAPAQVMTVEYNRLRAPAKITSDLSASPDARWIWAEAICAGLAWKLSLKFAPERTSMLKAEWLEQRAVARIESRERAPIVIGYASFGRSRRRRI